MKKITAYKGFDKDLKCRGFQFEIGESYTHKGEVIICSSGFHSCKDPMDVLSYYDLCDSRFAIVEVSGDTKNDKDDSKITSSHITIKSEISINDFINLSLDFVFKGWFKKAEKECDKAASGDSSQLAASGDYSKLAASGDYSKLAASGNYSKLAASGDSSQLAASGNYSQLAASGNYSKLAASGYSSQLAASGDSSQLAASGYSSKLAASGDYSVVSAVGYRSKIKGVKGTLVSLVFYKDGKPEKFVVGKIGRKLKADTWYTLDVNGKFVKAG